MDPDPVWWVRASLATALGELGDEMSVGILHSMLGDADARVLPAVLGALRRARGADSVDTLKGHLDYADTACPGKHLQDLLRSGKLQKQIRQHWKHSGYSR